MHFQGKEGFEQEETEKATKGQVKSQIKNKGKTLITNCYAILHFFLLCNATIYSYICIWMLLIDLFRGDVIPRLH